MSAPEIQEADPKARRIALAIVGGGALLGLVLLSVADRSRPQFEAWIRQDFQTRLRITIAAMTLLTTGPLLAFAGYFWRLGRQVVVAGRFPPGDLRMVRDVTVVTGEAAVRRGRYLQACGAFLGLAGLLLAFVLWRLVALAESTI
jgi:hypothetical protein